MNDDPISVTYFLSFSSAGSSSSSLTSSMTWSFMKLYLGADLFTNFTIIRLELFKLEGVMLFIDLPFSKTLLFFAFFRSLGDWREFDKDENVS